MAYEPKEWACGEIITAELLNHMERGIKEASAPPLVVKPLEQVGDWDFRVDKTFEEIAEYIESGRYDVVIASDDNVGGGSVYHLATVNYTSGKVVYVEFSYVRVGGGSVNVFTLSANKTSGDVFTGTKKSLS